MMNPTLVHMSNHSSSEDGFATANGYPLSSNGWAALEPRAAYDNRVAMMMAPQDVQGHTLQTNVSHLHHSSMTPPPPPRERRFYLNCLSPQVFAHWPSATAITEQYHVPFPPDQPYPEPVSHEFGSYSNFDSDRDLHVSQGHNAGANHETNYDYFWMGLPSSSPPSESDAGSVSPRVVPEQRGTMNGTPPASLIPPAWQRGAYVCGSEGDFYVCKEADDAPSAQFKGATAAHTYSNPFSLGGVCTVTAAQSPASTPPQYHPSLSQIPPSISRGRAHQDHAPRSQPLNPVPPNQRGVLCSAGRSEERTAQSRKASPSNVAGQEKPVRTLRSVRTRFGDVYAEHEQGPDESGGAGTSGRWVCQCGSTFVRDSDWERHAMHSLSHSAGGGFDCNLCDISFTRSDAMFRHRRKKHGIKTAPSRGQRDSEDEVSQPFPARGRPVTRSSSSSSTGKY